MSIKSRTLYNVEALFVAPYSGSTDKPFLSQYKILRPIKNIQSIDYAIEQPNLNLISFGNKSSVFKGPGGQPTVSLRFSYISDGLTNEGRLAFNSYTFQSSPTSSLSCVAFSGLDISNEKDQKDFYLAINEDINDIYKKDTSFDDAFLNPVNENSIIHKDSRNYGLLHFQNAYLSQYSFSLGSSSSPAIVSQEYVVDNMIFYPTGSGVKYSRLDLRSGVNEIKSDSIVIPRSLNNLSGQGFLFGYDATVTFSKNINSGVLFETDLINSLSFSLDFQRNSLSSINFKFPQYRNIRYPVLGKLNIGLGATGSLSGSFFETLDKNIDYNIVVDFKQSASKSATKFIFSGCKFDNISYGNSISDSFKDVALNFDFEQDLSNNSKGLFWSGNVEYGLLNSTKYILV